MCLDEYLIDMQPEVQAAWIQSLCGIIAATIAAGAAAYIGHKITKRKNLEDDFQRAKRDIAFLLAVESAHCDLHKKQVGKPTKNLIRSEVLKTGGYSWSARFTPGRDK